MTLVVDPRALDGAGAAVVSTGADIGSTLSRLTATLSGSAGMCGDDPVGAAMGRSYDRAAQSLLAAMTAARNGLTNIGDGVRVSAYNYSRANASSDVSGRGQALPVPTATGQISAGTLPSAVGSGDDAPAGWGWVHKYIGMIWPNGDPATLRTAAAAWTAAGTALLNTELAVAAPMGIVGEQQIPEADAMGRAFGDSVRGAGQVLASCAQLSTSLNGYATHVETTQAAIIDLLARICDPMTGIKLIWDFLTSEDEDEIAAIAADIKTVVANFEAETSALAAQLAPVIAEAATTVTEMGRWADREWRHFLEDTVAGQELNGVGQTVKGFGGQAVDLLKDSWKYSPQRANIDPGGSLRDYQGLVEGMAPLVGLGGDGAPGIGDAWLKVGKDTLHWDLWEKNPGEALGRSLFDVATFFVPGGGLTKLGKVGTGAAHAAEDVATAAPRALDAAARIVDAPKPVVPHVEAPTAKPAEPVAAAPRPGEPVPGPHPGGATDPAVPKNTEPIPVSTATGPRHIPAPSQHGPTETHPATTASSPSADTGPRGGGSPLSQFAEPATLSTTAPLSAADLPPKVAELPEAFTATATGTPDLLARGGHALGPAHSGPGDYGSGLASPAPAAHPSVIGGDPSFGVPPPGGAGHQPGGHDVQPNNARNDLDRLPSDPNDREGDPSATDLVDSDTPGLSAEKIREIVSAEKGHRPDPCDYLSPEYIERHLGKFIDGATRFMPEPTFNKYGIAQSDGTSFVVPKYEADKLAELVSDPRALEDALGLPEGFLESNKLLRIDIPDPRDYNLRIPSGNEAGVNQQWIPGGQLPDGSPEAIVDGGSIPPQGYTKTQLNHPTDPED